MDELEEYPDVRQHFDFNNTVYIEEEFLGMLGSENGDGMSGYGFGEVVGQQGIDISKFAYENFYDPSLKEEDFNANNSFPSFNSDKSINNPPHPSQNANNNQQNHSFIMENSQNLNQNVNNGIQNHNQNVNNNSNQHNHQGFQNQNQFKNQNAANYNVNNTSQSVFFPSNTTFTPQQFTQQALQAHQVLLNEIHRHQIDQKDILERMFQDQRKIMLEPKAEDFNRLTQQQKQLKLKIEEELNALQSTHDNVSIDPPDLQKLLWLKQDLEVQQKQLDLLINELLRLANQDPPLNCLASLIILKQPFPVVISKSKQLTEEQLQVQLLISSNLQVQQISSVRATLLCDTSQGKGSVGKMIEGDIQNLNTNTRIVKFPLKFLAGTKKVAANIRFEMDITSASSGKNSTAIIESNTSQPFVVITNECQWEGSAGTLLKKSTFSAGQLQVPWQRFANCLQFHFLKATKQELNNPRRFLSQTDLAFLHSKFFENKHLISQKDFDDFWEWFGKAMQKIRYQRHIGSMWQNGLLYGFMGRDEVNAALHNQPQGAFVIRFSERHAGQFAIAYVGDSSHKIKHYLVQPNDTSASRRTLPDFLDERREFTSLLVFGRNSEGKLGFVKNPKHIALEPYCGKKQPTVQEDDELGYEPLPS
eukprot:TRINITY_DN3990_c0_g2_i1.p1 TRINITY_DN3990_c0_g2~~TRINITY_DN3990_c0_g2_i1.p1  ORF type:complete len:685 (-),score=202.19 TRINITY_DN3990_c0_g2_i1:40-1977(-)